MREPRRDEPSRDEAYFLRLRETLTEQGVATRYIDRLIAELEDHCADAAAEQGVGAHRIGSTAWLRDRLGEESAIVSQVMLRPRLRGRLSGCRAMLRALDRQGIEWAAVVGNAAVAGPLVMRWSASIACGTMITAALLLAMAQSLALNV